MEEGGLVSVTGGWGVGVGMSSCRPDGSRRLWLCCSCGNASFL